MYSKDGVVSKALTLIGKLQNKYGFKPKFYNLASPCPSPERGELPTIYEEAYEEDSGFTEHDWVGVFRLHTFFTLNTSEVIVSLPVDFF